MIPYTIAGGASLRICYHVELERWRANLRLVARAPHDGTRWMAYLAWGPHRSRDHEKFSVEGKVRYWKRPARIPDQ